MFSFPASVIHQAIHYVVVGLMNERADVKFDKTVLSDCDVEAMITNLGYPATIISRDELKDEVDFLVRSA